MPHPLDESYDDKPVTALAVKIMKTGDGLSDALEVDPVCHHEGEPGYYLVKTNTRQIAYQRRKQTDRGLTRYETHDAIEVVEVGSDDGESLLAKQRAHLNTLRERQAQQREEDSLFNAPAVEYLDVEPGIDGLADPDDEWEVPARDSATN